MSHETHCNQGEYEGSCKYGEASTCPMLKEPTPQEPDGSVPGGTATPAGCGPLEPVAYADKATYAYCIKEGKGFDVWPLIGELTNPDNVVRIYGPEAADTIAALQSLVGEDKLALGKQLAQSNAERQQLQEAVAALQAENAELRKNYNELIMSVGRKFPDETRHQTALRYIQTTETQCSGACRHYRHVRVD